MKCYYEELGVARDANDADIKSAYRKMALRWHPDKNPDALAEAKERFQLIQQAYEVLSDPQERTWYDNHREQILRGKNSDYIENCLDVFEYFTSSCFRGYGDDDKGFYAVYKEVFEKIAAEDAEFVDDDKVEHIPSFGDSQSDYEDVVGPFYAYWQAYCTKKTYTWLCPYDIKEIKDRRILREVEKEMKKVVQKARKERNEEVRNLVSFVRKRDKRVQAYRKLLEERADMNRKKQAHNRLEQIRKRQRELAEMRQASAQNEQLNNEDYEAQLKQLAQHYGDSSAEEESESDLEEDEENENEVLKSGEEEYYVDDLYCVACNKAFKNERAYENHESSKRHREAFERMKLQMQAEEETYEGNDVEAENDELLEGVAEAPQTLSDDVMATPSSNSVSSRELNELDDELGNINTEEELLPDRKSKKNKTRKNTKHNKPLLPATDDEQEDSVTDFLVQAKIADNEEEEDWSGNTKKGTRKNKKMKQSKKTLVEDKANVTQQDVKLSETDEQEVTSERVIESENEPVKKSTSKSKPKVAEVATGSSHVCITCRANFSSKNKLFAHLKITNHGVYIPKEKTEKAASAEKEGKSKKGKGKKK